MQTKFCSDCKLSLPISDFHKSITQKDGYAHHCKPCHKKRGAEYYKKNKERIRAVSAEYNALPENKVKQQARVRRWQYKTKYGLTVDEREKMIAEQNGKCAICGTDFSELAYKLIHVDHCHKSQKVRGILCNKCNNVLGHAGKDGDNISVLENAINYLKTHFVK